MAEPARQHGQLEDPALGRLCDGRVGRVVGIRPSAPQRQHEQIAGHEEHDEGHDRLPPAARQPAGRGSHGYGGQRGQSERGDGEQPARDTGKAERREDVAKRLVEREVRAEGEEHRHEHAHGEDCCEQDLAAANEYGDARDAEQGQEPAEVREVLEAAPRGAAQQIQAFRGVVVHLGERPPGPGGRLLDHRLAQEQADGDRRRHACSRPRQRGPTGADHRVGGQERNGTEGEVHLAGQGERRRSRARTASRTQRAHVPNGRCGSAHRPRARPGGAPPRGRGGGCRSA